MTEEMGKPIAAAEAEIDKCSWVCRYYAENGDEFLTPHHIRTDGSSSYVSFEPLGVVLAIMPWNYPFWQVFRFAAPALAAGNAVVLKHAPNVPRCATAIESVFQEAGLHADLFQNVMIDNDTVARVIGDPRIDAITLTGSVRAGRAVAARAGAHIKKVVLELGGSDPFVVLADAHLDLAVSVAVASRTQNNGQSCIAAKRFIIEDSVLEAFTERFVGEVGKLRVGDPRDRSVDIGPLARADLRDSLHDQVERSVATGARLQLGGRALPGDGFFYAPTVLSGVRPGMAAFDEETFGPVAAIIRAEDEADALRLANRSRYGLGATVFTGDAARGEKFARGLQAGNVFVNGMVKSDPRLPFGGIKESGYGRELSVFGIREFVNIKTVWVR
jgi:succinate-semialdehyde dehydrogenase/glutarate-semialdehyde dehydrogenase